MLTSCRLGSKKSINLEEVLSINSHGNPPDSAVPKPVWDLEFPQPTTSPHMGKYLKYIFILEFPNF